MAGNFNLRAIISAVDNMSPTLRSINRNLQGFRRQLDTVGRGAVIQAGIVAAAMAAPAKAFADLENSQAFLQNALMDKNGVARGLAAISAATIKLGNQLPGTTADFAIMAAKLRGFTVSPEAIAGGVLRASAYLSVANKDLGVTYDGATEAVGKMGNGFKLAQDEYEEFADLLSRAGYTNIALDGLNLASSKSIGLLDTLGLTGLKVAKQMVPLQGILLAKGMSPEIVGTGIRKIIEDIAEHRKVKDIEKDVIGFLDKVNKRADRQKRLTDMFGENWVLAAEITKDAFKKTQDSMENQSSLLQKVGVLSGTLTNKTDSLSGSFTNLAAIIGKIYAPQLKNIADMVNNMIPDIGDWITKNKTLIEQLGKLALTVTGVRLAVFGLSLAVGALSGVMRLNPTIAAFSLLAVAGVMVYDSWDNLKEFFKTDFVDALKWVGKQFENMVNGLLLRINSISEAFGLSFLKTSEFKLPDLSGMLGGIGDFFSQSSDASMRPPGSQGVLSGQGQSGRKNILQGGRSDRLHVQFDNAPHGLRVTPAKTNSSRTVVDVGYRTIGGAQGAW